MDEIEIEAFRADTRASKGLTAAHIAEAATSYDPDKNPAPLVFGHPASDSPALGIISGARAEGNRLFLKLKNIKDEVVQGVRERRILNRSIAFWAPDHPSNPTPGKYAIRHLGFLGGMAPAIPNLPALKFSADETVLETEEAPEPAVIFEAEDSSATPVVTVKEPVEKPGNQEESTMTEAEIQALRERADNAEAEAKREREAREAKDKEFAAAEKARRESENVASVEKVVTEGKVLPAEKDDLVQIFNALPTQALTFSTGEAEPRAALVSFLDKLPKRTAVNEPRKSPTEGKEFDASDSKAKAEQALQAANEATQNAYKPAANA